MNSALANSQTIGILRLINRARAHVGCVSPEFGGRPIYHLPRTREELADAIGACFIDRACHCCFDQVSASFDRPSAAVAASIAWDTPATFSDPLDDVRESACDLPTELALFACSLPTTL